jgi:sugar phosphate isomerase/epimerase
VAEQLGVQLLIEPEPHLMIETFGQHLQFMKRIKSPSVGLNFDIGHAYCVGENPEEWVRTMAPFTRHYHLEDIAADRVHKHLIPGRGAIDFAATLVEIAKTGYQGWITVELYPYIDNPDAAAREAREHLLGVAGQLDIQIERR